ncbi:GNAT family N-acetyltransferase [Sediminibacterium sp.]|uniref:GNAT family N-acetyltransferase n=1 Tax=Sediminibacterium sp. TaxID=1917865 RepID=UPI0025FDB052|nr:GNAT family N-acetyltransferase [Sediminibacterium sp.]MBT9484718.1 GNAT family N-acetyltransferase [Sediminibacterium sp.]
MNWQPEYLENDLVKLVPLAETHFEQLYAVASDPLIWEQHPNKNRYQLTVFKNFFEGAILSKGAFLITDAQTNEAIGSSRFCNFTAEKKMIEIGYTFYARKYWGKGYNRSTKQLMINYALEKVNTVHFFVGAENIRSQKAMEKLGAVKLGEVLMPYYGEPDRLNFQYQIDQNLWDATNSKDE